MCVEQSMVKRWNVKRKREPFGEALSFLIYGVMGVTW